MCAELRQAQQIKGDIKSTLNTIQPTALALVARARHQMDAQYYSADGIGEVTRARAAAEVAKANAERARAETAKAVAEAAKAARGKRDALELRKARS